MLDKIKLKGLYHKIPYHKNDHCRIFIWGLCVIGSERYNIRFKTLSGRGIEAVYRKSVIVNQNISKKHIRKLLISDRNYYAMSKYSHVIFRAFIELLDDAIARKGGFTSCEGTFYKVVKRVKKKKELNDFIYWKYFCISQLDSKLSYIGAEIKMNSRNRNLFEEMKHFFDTNESGVIYGQYKAI